jgi:hypothetical protein
MLKLAHKRFELEIWTAARMQSITCVAPAARKDHSLSSARTRRQPHQPESMLAITFAPARNPAGIGNPMVVSEIFV